MDSRLAAAVAARARGERMNVTGVCRGLGITPKTFYKYLARFVDEGVDGFFPRSRRPLTNPATTSPGMDEAIVRARKELDDQGDYNGAISIGWRLEDTGVVPPSRATIHRVLVRRGQVVPQPRKRPRAANHRRFEAPRPNAMWQLDGFEHRLADGRTVVVLQLIDDHSRLALASRAAPSENGRDAWAVFTTAAARWGLPRALLTDNGSAFNGHRRGYTTELETRLRALGVTPITCSVGHPQTCGKDERAHATLQRWLTKHAPAEDLEQLQTQLDAYDTRFNNRRHQGIGGLTPRQRWDLADKVGTDGRPIPPPPEITHRTVSAGGGIGVDGHEIGLGRRHHGAQATVFRTGDHVTVFIGSAHIRSLEIDRNRRYQPAKAHH